MLRRMDDHAQELASGVGWVSLGMGFALTLEPRKSAVYLGWGDGERLARVIGASDLVVGTGLLLDPNRSRWMLVRALLNTAIGLAYVRLLAAGTPQRKRAGGGVGLMAVLTVFDYLVSRRLREAEAL